MKRHERGTLNAERRTPNAERLSGITLYCCFRCDPWVEVLRQSEGGDRYTSKFQYTHKSYTCWRFNRLSFFLFSERFKAPRATALKGLICKAVKSVLKLKR